MQNENKTASSKLEIEMKSRIDGQREMNTNAERKTNGKCVCEKREERERKKIAAHEENKYMTKQTHRQK